MKNYADLQARIKSAPRTWQQERHGKPHREQDRIGMVAPQGAGAFSLCRPGWSREAHREVRPRGMVVPHFRVRTEPGLQAVWRFRCTLQMTARFSK